jgi:mono/diheme cytochrome c family protein
MRDGSIVCTCRTDSEWRAAMFMPLDQRTLSCRVCTLTEKRSPKTSRPVRSNPYQSIKYLAQSERQRTDEVILARGVVIAGILAALSGCTDKGTSVDDPRADPRDTGTVALGKKLYAQHCSACHGTELEGQPNWRSRLPNGRLPAPPHDESGHTWHHADQLLFDITKHGLVWPYAPKDYQSDMPAFGGTLSDDGIWAVLAYIKSHWRSPHVISARKEMTRNLSRN